MSSANVNSSMKRCDEMVSMLRSSLQWRDYRTLLMLMNAIAVFSSFTPEERSVAPYATGAFTVIVFLKIVTLLKGEDRLKDRPDRLQRKVKSYFTDLRDAALLSMFNDNVYVAICWAAQWRNDLVLGILALPVLELLFLSPFTTLNQFPNFVSGILMVLQNCGCCRDWNATEAQQEDRVNFYCIDVYWAINIAYLGTFFFAIVKYFLISDKEVPFSLLGYSISLNMSVLWAVYVILDFNLFFADLRQPIKFLVRTQARCKDTIFTHNWSALSPNRFEKKYFTHPTVDGANSSSQTDDERSPLLAASRRSGSYSGESG